MVKIAICANCLTTFEAKTYGHGLQIGGEHGNQRDPTYDYIDVCTACGLALVKGDFATIHERYRERRSVRLSAGAVEEAEE